MAGAGKTMWNSLWPLAAGITIAAAIQLALPERSGPYYSRIAIDIGIAMIMAVVSLNIVNGWTGEGSGVRSGTPGFMTLGGYAAGIITFYGSMLLWIRRPSMVGRAGRGCSRRRVSWAVWWPRGPGGMWSGCRRCGCGGDYLAIVTLGSARFYASCWQQTDDVIDSPQALRSATIHDLLPPPVGGAVGFDGIPKYTNLFWVYAFCGDHGRLRVSAQVFELGAGDDLDSRGRDRGSGDGREHRAVQGAGVCAGRVFCWDGGWAVLRMRAG